MDADNEGSETMNKQCTMTYAGEHDLLRCSLQEDHEGSHRYESSMSNIAAAPTPPIPVAQGGLTRERCGSVLCRGGNDYMTGEHRCFLPPQHEGEHAWFYTQKQVDALLATNPGEKGAEAATFERFLDALRLLRDKNNTGTTYIGAAGLAYNFLFAALPARQDNGDALRKIITSLEDRSIVLCNTDASQWKCRLCGAMQDGPGADGKHNVSCPIRDLRELAAPLVHQGG